jgi:hypothetical protein
VKDQLLNSRPVQRSTKERFPQLLNQFSRLKWLVAVTLLDLLRLSAYSDNDRNSVTLDNLFDPIYISPSRTFKCNNFDKAVTFDSFCFRHQFMKVHFIQLLEILDY